MPKMTDFVKDERLIALINETAATLRDERIRRERLNASIKELAKKRRLSTPTQQEHERKAA